MSASNIALPLRGDTLLGVCEAIGEDFSFHPNILRIAFAVALLWNPAAVFCAYLALGAIVAASRLVIPDPRRMETPKRNVGETADPAEAERVQSPVESAQPEELAVAA
jgi:phage shock protein PspC (stress-responsive transcriptional regulator)